MSKKDLAKLMQSSPVAHPTKREQITPANLYDNASIPASQHTGTPVSPQDSKPVQPLTVTPASPPTSPPAPQQDSKPAITKYTTYLTTDTVKRLKRYAFENETKATQVIQQAVDKYLKSKGV